MGNFRSRLRDATKILATHPEKIKYRLQKAILDELLLADVAESENIPNYFRDDLRQFIDEVSSKQWTPDVNCDRVRATLHGKHGKTLSKLALRIWKLHHEYEEYLASGFIPSGDT